MHKHRLLAALVATFAIACLGAPSAVAVPVVDGEFEVSAQPGRSTLGPDGNVWVILGSVTNPVAKIEPDGTVTEYAAATLQGATDITSGPNDTLWVTTDAGVASFSPADPVGTADETPIANAAFAQGIASDGTNIWVANTDKLIRIPADNPAGFQSFDDFFGSARGAVIGGDGQLWVADFTNGVIVQLSLSPAPVGTAYPTGGNPQEVAAGTGDQIGYTDAGTDPDHIGRITPGGTPLKTEVPGTDAFGIAFGSDQAYWIANFLSQDLGRLTPDGQYTTLSGFSAGLSPRHITVGANNTLWVSLEDNVSMTDHKVARVSGLGPPVPPNGGGETPDTTAPFVTALSMAKAFRVGKARTPIAAQRRRRIRTGTTIRYRLSEAAAVRLRIERVLPGRRRAGKCVKPRRKLRKARRCKRFRHVRTLRRTGVEGANAVPFSGRIGRRALRAGRYRLVVRAIDEADNRSTPKRKGFRVVRAAKRKRG